MTFFQSAIGTLQTLVVALGAGLGIWGGYVQLVLSGDIDEYLKGPMEHNLEC